MLVSSVFLFFRSTQASVLPLPNFSRRIMSNNLVPVTDPGFFNLRAAHSHCYLYEVCIFRVVRVGCVEHDQ